MSQQEDSNSFYNLFLPSSTKKVILLLTIIGFAIYFIGLFNGFVWDDNVFIVNNPEVHSINLWTQFSHNRFNSADYYRPLPALFFALLYSVSHDQPFLFHFIQVCLHISVTILLYFVFREYFKRGLAFILALLFLIHPVNVESVAYIGASQSELLTLFGLMALYILINKKISNTTTIALIGLLTILALLTKESAVIFPVAIVLWSFLYQRKNVIKYFITETVACIIYVLIRLHFNPFFSNVHQVSSIAHLSLGERLLNIPAIISHYIILFVFPLQLAVDQQWVVTQPAFTTFFLPLIVDLFVLLFITYFGFEIWRKKRSLFNTYLWFLIWLFVSGLFLLQIYPLDMTVADRWVYVPLMGMLGIVGCMSKYLQETYQKSKKSLLMVAIAILLIFSVQTFIRITNWSDEITLFSHDIQVSDNFDIENNLGAAYFVHGDIQNALMHEKKSVSLFPYELNLNNLGTAYLYSGNLDLAQQAFSRAIQADSYSDMSQVHYAGTYKRLAWTYLYIGDFTKAKSVILAGLREYPNDDTLWYELALTQYKLHDNTALDSVHKALSINPFQQNYNYLLTHIKNNQQIQLGSDNVSINVVGP